MSLRFAIWLVRSLISDLSPWIRRSIEPPGAATPLTTVAKPLDQLCNIALTPFGFDASAASSFVVSIVSLPSTESCENGASPDAAPVVIPILARPWMPVRLAFGV